MNREPMKKLLDLVLIPYWAAVGYFPFALKSYWQHYRAAIGCPPSGDCYVRGAEHLLDLELLFGAAAILFWPLACIKLFNALRRLFARN